MNVYLVYYGEYSDWGFLGVFSTREKAERYAKWCDASLGMWSSAEVLEMEVDKDHPARASGLRPFLVTFWNQQRSSRPPMCAKGSFTEEYLECGHYNVDMEIGVFARDQAHALKIAADRRAKHLAGIDL